MSDDDVKPYIITQLEEALEERQGIDRREKKIRVEDCEEKRKTKDRRDTQ